MEPEVTSGYDWLPVLLQTADPLFPTGAYAHSFGLEELVRLGAVRDETSLGDFLLGHLLPQLELFELPYLRFGIALSGSIENLIELDLEIQACKLSQEARSSSTQIGIRRITALRVHSQHALLLDYDAAVKAGRAPGNHVCACAIQAVVYETPLEAALATYGYQSLAGACTAALKLLRIGQDGIQRALTRGLASLSEVVRRSNFVLRDEAGCFSPMLEIASMRHAHANERLFIS
jgi:urease accessory protein